MGFIDIDLMKKKLSHYKIIPDYLKTDYEMDFKVRFTHHSTAIEGNTLTLIETKMIVEDSISVGGKNLREIHEVENFAAAYDYVKACVKDKKPLSENIVKDIHELLMNKIMPGGIYRSHDVYISGSEHQPPSPQEAYYQIKDFFHGLEQKKQLLHPIEYSTYVHAEFVKIHPFTDGNGRTSRLILNYSLLENGYRPILIKVDDKLEYFNCLEEYSVKGNIQSFVNFVAKLEEYELDRYVKIVEQHHRSLQKNESVQEME